MDKNSVQSGCSSPHSNRSPIKFSTPTSIRSEKQPPLSTIFNQQYEECLDEDVTLLRRKERSIYDLNDQNIALARVVTNQMNQIAILKNQIRNMRLNYLANKKTLDERKSAAVAQQSEYDDATSRLNNVNKTKGEIKKNIQQLNKITEQIQSSLKNVFDSMTPESPETRNLYQTLTFEVDQLKSLIQMRQNRIQELRELKEKCNKDLEEINQKSIELTETQEEIVKKNEELDSRDEIILDSLTTPYDPITNEEEYVLKIEREVEQWSKRLDNYPLTDTSKAVKQSVDALYVIQQENDEKKQKLSKKKDDIAQANLKMTAASRAVASTTKYLTTVATAKGGQMLSHQHRLAINTVKDIFLKIGQKEQEVQDTNIMLDKMTESHNKSKKPIMDEWNQKMDKVESLSKHVIDIDSIIIDMARISNETDELKREEAEHKYEIEKVHRTKDNLQTDQERVQKKQKEIQIIKERVERNKQQLEEKEAELKEKREQIELEKEKANELEKGFLENEKAAEEFKQKTNDVSQKLEYLTEENKKLMEMIGLSKNDDETEPKDIEANE